MSENDWMRGQSVSDIQTAIQSQAIQTALESNTSKITDAGFQSYLQNAPIPRAYFLETATNTVINTGAEATIVFGQASVKLDQYKILSTTANTFQIPIDGFYVADMGIGWASTAGATSYAAYAGFKSVSGTYGVQYLKLDQRELPILTSAVIFSVTMVKPFRAGDQFKLVAFQASGTNQNSVVTDTASPTLSISWVAPYNQYTTGAGGN